MVERTLPELTKDLVSQVADLFRSEVRLARAEAVESLRGLMGGVAAIGMGLALGTAAAVMLLMSLTYLLAFVMHIWIAALASAIVGAIVAYMMVRAGSRAMANNKMALPRTQANVAKDIRSIKERVSS